VTEAKRFTTAKLSIVVKPVDTHPPEIHASASVGKAIENSPLGTKVLDLEGQPIRLMVTDKDLVNIYLPIHRCCNFCIYFVNLLILYLGEYLKITTILNPVEWSRNNKISNPMLKK